MLTHKNYYHNANQCVVHYGEDVPKFAKNFVILPVDHSFAHTAAIYGALGFPLTLYFLDSRGGSVQALKNIPINLKEVKPYFLYTVPALTGNFMKKIQENIRKQSKFVQWLFNWGLNAGIKKIGDGVERPGAIARFFLSIPHGLADLLIFKKIRQSFGNYKFSIGGGALLDIAQQKFFASIGMPIMQGYGLSEATPVISANKPSDFRLGSSGKPLPDLEVKIVREGKELPQGQKGEIIVRGDNVMKGYFKNPEATAKTLENGWLHTGDMGYIDEYGFLYVTGREKALLIGEDGEKYSPEEIEETIQSTSPFVYQIMLYNDHSKYTTAIITLD
jgi:long-chain acyl-CoA synthetase